MSITSKCPSAVLKRNQRQRNKLKQNKLNEKTARHREYQRRYETKKKEKQHRNLISPPDYSNRMPRSCGIGRLRKLLPASPSQRTQLMASYLKTKSPNVHNFKDVFQCSSDES
ncbi:hypothetical protein DPMN_104491 [Dreissena polymorpha]|uniref:Uncharacterized protein n=1 Tax=Dreissena polymorpha TaxID=45954 RepID=A0A9D4K1Q4_DREPO|nr:hypothetical protein DPMN_104491 [Dreissena polymorpha]